VIVAKRNDHSFKKYQKELRRKKKADEKIARRQGKRDKDAATINSNQVSILEQDESGEPATSE
jgi:hypothetical protein